MDLRQYAAQSAPPPSGAPPAPPHSLLAPERPQEAQGGAEVYKKYQEATRASESAKTAIIKGILAGANPYRLLLTATDCIGKLTGDTSFLDITKADLLQLHGDVLGEPQALEIELAEVEDRLERLRAAQSTMRVQSAIREHEARAEELRSRIK